MRNSILHYFTWLHITWFDKNTQAHCLFTKTPTLLLPEKTCQFTKNRSHCVCFFFAFIQFGDRWNNHDFWEPCTYTPYTWMGISHCYTPQYVCSFIYIAGMINKDVNSSLLLLGYVSPVSFHDDHVPCLLTPFCACCYIHTYISVLMECRRRRRTIAYAPGHACRPSTNNTCIQQQYY